MKESTFLHIIVSKITQNLDKDDDIELILSQLQKQTYTTLFPIYAGEIME